MADTIPESSAGSTRHPENGIEPRVLIIRRRYLGDILLLSQAVQSLRRAWPRARITLLVERRFAEAVWLLPEVDAPLLLPVRATEWPGFLRLLRRHAFTHVIDYDNRAVTALAARLTGAPFRAAFPIGRAQKVAAWVYHRWITMPQETFDSLHMGEVYLWALRPLGVSETPPPYRLAVSATSVAWAAEWLREKAPRLWSVSANRRVVLHPGSRSDSRRWPAEKFARLCDWLSDEKAAAVALAGGPGEEAFLDRISDQCRRPPERLGAGHGLQKLAALFSHAEVFVGHDSGPAHLAAGLGMKVVCLAGTQTMQHWRPRSSHLELLQAPLPCPRCFDPQRCVPHDSYRNLCVGHIRFDDVSAALERALFPV